MKKWESKSNHIASTTAYDVFRRLDGNRDLKDNRVKKIIHSIERVGYMPVPIVVNEKMEIIDGQGRVEACRRLGLPVYYMIVEGAGVKECIAMNINQSNWVTIDYIKSYADNGVTDYQYILQCLKAYANTFKQKVILYALTGRIEQSGRTMKEGEAKCTEEDYNHAVKMLEYLKEFTTVFNDLDGHNEYYYTAIMFCYDCPDVDKDRLRDKVLAYQASLKPVSNIQQAFEQLESVYNYKARGGKVYLKTVYREAMDGKYGWYSARYGNKY